MGRLDKACLLRRVGMENKRCEKAEEMKKFTRHRALLRLKLPLMDASHTLEGLEQYGHVWIVFQHFSFSSFRLFSVSFPSLFRLFFVSFSLPYAPPRFLFYQATIFIFHENTNIMRGIRQDRVSSSVKVIFLLKLMYSPVSFLCIP
jgi:hypothetical protein